MPNQIVSEDQELLNLLHTGENNALTLVYNKYWKMMYLASYNLVKNKTVSEDIVQDIFVYLWNNRANLTIKTSLKNYLYTSTMYKVYDHFRKSKAQPSVELFENFHEKITHSTPETQFVYDELMAHIDALIEELPDRCKQVFRLSRDEQLSNKEIAAKLNISLRTVEGHISKALKHLKSSLIISLLLIILEQKQ
ncbi:RNA polymerase sigma-70 factor [Flavobacteriaceae bacterium F08102]|nr:RNA polymerase sigma-70 factor [Flavobacteriaceae bacterium F08102]